MTNKVFLNRVVLITGGSSGIGRAAALRFAEQGAKVVIAGRRVAQGEAVQGELEALGAEAHFMSIDVSQPDQVQRLLDRTIDRFGRLDCAFNNAAALDVGIM